MGCHEVVIKDTSGLLSPQATWELVTALKQTVKVPIDIHSHCSSGMAPMAYMAGVEAGAEVVATHRSVAYDMQAVVQQLLDLRHPALGFVEDAYFARYLGPVTDGS